MIQRIKIMWYAFLSAIKCAFSAGKHEPIDRRIQPYTDISRINWLAMAVRKLTNLACNEATFEIESDSVQTEPLSELLKNIEEHRFDITEGMLADGDYYVFPEVTIGDKAAVTHTFIDSSRVRITEIRGDDIAAAYAVVDEMELEGGRYLFLQRCHKLDDSGNLTVSFMTVDESGRQVQDGYFDTSGQAVVFYGANHIGFGRYKSPVSSRGLSSVYGVPLNFGCSDIEKKINDTVEQIEYEFKNARSKIFTDPRNLIRSKDENGREEYIFGDNIVPVKRNAGDTGAQIDIFNPSIRSSEHWEKLGGYLEKYEQQIGVSKGIFTENKATDTATATAVKRANSDTISLLNAIHNSLDRGNLMTLRADSVYLNIRSELWSYKSDYYDPFEDPSEQWTRLREAKEAGAAEAADLVKWLNPDFTKEQIDEKMTRISESNASVSNQALEQALLM